MGRPLRIVQPGCNRGGRPRKDAPRSVFSVERGADYTADQLEFMLAMDRWKREHRTPFPSWSDVLNVLLSLGYRKAPDAA